MSSVISFYSIFPLVRFHLWGLAPRYLLQHQLYRDHNSFEFLFHIIEGVVTSSSYYRRSQYRYLPFLVLLAEQEQLRALWWFTRPQSNVRCSWISCRQVTSITRLLLPTLFRCTLGIFGICASFLSRMFANRLLSLWASFLDQPNSGEGLWTMDRWWSIPAREGTPKVQTRWCLLRIPHIHYSCHQRSPLLGLLGSKLHLFEFLVAVLIVNVKRSDSGASVSRYKRVLCYCDAILFIEGGTMNSRSSFISSRCCDTDSFSYSKHWVHGIHLKFHRLDFDNFCQVSIVADLCMNHLAICQQSDWNFRGLNWRSYP